VAGGVARGEKDEFVFFAGFVEGFLPPRVPVDGVAGVLE